MRVCSQCTQMLDALFWPHCSIRCVLTVMRCTIHVRKTWEMRKFCCCCCSCDYSCCCWCLMAHACTPGSPVLRHADSCLLAQSSPEAGAGWGSGTGAFGTAPATQVHECKGRSHTGERVPPTCVARQRGHMAGHFALNLARHLRGQVLRGVLSLPPASPGLDRTPVASQPSGGPS